MTPAARLSAAIELLDLIAAAARDEGPAADTLIARYFKERRYAGSKDRRAVRNLVYEVIRAVGERPDSGRAAMLAYARARCEELLPLFGSGLHSPASIDAGEPVASLSFAPDWLTEKLGLPEAGLAALLGRAPLDLRANRLKTSREALAALLPPTSPTPLSPLGLRAQEPFAVEAHPAFLDGLVEVQDEGSQLACLSCEAAPGMTVVDLCAGAGGKTLALAAAMENQGRLIACDADRARLDRLPPRGERAGATIIERRLLDPGREAEALTDLVGAADLVLVDAPCSGTGTWRRNPEARWRLTPKRLHRLVSLQARLIDLAATLVRPGGRLVYVVCSLLPEEGPRQADAFLARAGGWGRVRDDLTLTPYSHGTDGFFIAGLSPI